MYYFDEACINLGVRRFACVCFPLCICVRNEKKKKHEGKAKNVV